MNKYPQKKKVTQWFTVRISQPIRRPVRTSRIIPTDSENQNTLLTTQRVIHTCESPSWRRRMKTPGKRPWPQSCGAQWRSRRTGKAAQVTATHVTAHNIMTILSTFDASSTPFVVMTIAINDSLRCPYAYTCKYKDEIMACADVTILRAVHTWVYVGSLHTKIR